MTRVTGNESYFAAIQIFASDIHRCPVQRQYWRLWDNSGRSKGSEIVKSFRLLLSPCAIHAGFHLEPQFGFFSTSLILKTEWLISRKVSTLVNFLFVN
jgi:hypothetical protein